MEQRELGRSGIKVSALGLGLMSMSGVYGNANDEESIGVIHYALDKGINFLDSADMYGWGHNETLLGKALKGRRDKVVVATKFGQVKLADGKQGVDGRPEYVMQACEASLKRLGIEVIDLYYQHRVDTNTPIEETVGAMKRLVEQGKVRALGLSEARPETIRRAHKVHPIAAVQNEYSLLYQERRARKRCRRRASLGITLVPYAPLGRSMLTGTVHGKADLPEGDRRLQHPRFQGEALDKNVQLVRPARSHRAGKEMHACPARAGVAARAGQRHRSDPGHQAQAAHRRELGGFEHQAFARRREAHLGRRARGSRCGHALSRGNHEARVPLRSDDATRWLALATMWSLQYLFLRVAVPTFGTALVAEGRAIRRAFPRALGCMGRAPAHRAARALERPPRGRAGQQRGPVRVLRLGGERAPGRLPRGDQRHGAALGRRSSPCRC